MEFNYLIKIKYNLFIFFVTPLLIAAYILLTQKLFVQILFLIYNHFLNHNIRKKKKVDSHKK